MNADEPSLAVTRPAFRAPFPIFSVRDLPRSIAFFWEALGFEPGYRWPAEGPLDEVAFIVLALGRNSVGLGRNPSAAPPPAADDEPLEQLPVQLCHGRRAITADTALRLSRWLGTDDEFWMNLQTRYDLDIAKDRKGDAIARIVSPVPTLVSS